MSYEMTRPAQKWLGAGQVAMAFLILLFTVAVPYVNHFGDPDHRFSYFTKWSGKWRSDLLPANTYAGGKTLFDFPAAGPIFIALGLVIILAGALYTFWLTYSNKACYLTHEKPGPLGGAIVVVGSIFALIGNLVYESWAFGAPRPLVGWPGSKNFLVTSVRISPTFWIGIAFLLILFGLGTTSIIYYLDTLSKRPVK